MSNDIILYDLASRQGKSWSLNPWKPRLVMNYKGIPYKTEFLEYPELEPTFKKFGIPPNETGNFKYTSPTIRLPNGRYVMDSRKIADVLEAEYPDPPLHLDSPYQERVEDVLKDVLDNCRPIFAPLAPKVFLNTASQGYIAKSRQELYGKTLDELYQEAEPGFEKAKTGIKKLGDLLDENPAGPFFEGSKPIYADFMVVAWLKMMDGLGWAERIFACEGGKQLLRLYRASSKWLERDN